jgi:hypothetical protein
LILLLLLLLLLPGRSQFGPAQRPRLTCAHNKIIIIIIIINEKNSNSITNNFFSIHLNIYIMRVAFESISFDVADKPLLLLF